MSISTPTKIKVPFAQSGLRAAIAATSDNVNGRAGYDQGFPPINLTPKTAGGIPPFGQDMNGILYDVTLALQYLEAGGQFPYDASFATAVGGYPAGALVSRSDLNGVWRNTVAGNTSDPEAGGTGWIPEGAGATTITMTSANVTLTALQATRSVIIINGTLTANLQLIFPQYVKVWQILNAATGPYSVTCKTATGLGVDVPAGASRIVYGDGGSIVNSMGVGNAAYATVMANLSDATAGRLMPVGAWGIGGEAIPTTNPDGIVKSGCYWIDFGTTWANTPQAGNSYKIFHLQASGSGNGYAMQIAQSWTPGATLFIRSRDPAQPTNGGWGTWATVFSTNNVSAFIQTLFDDPDALTARTTLGACGITAPSTVALSGTSVDITGVPSWAKRIRICFNSSSLNATAATVVQLGTSGGIVSSGYNGSVGVFSNGASIVQSLSSGVQINATNAAASVSTSGILEFETMGGNVWAFKSSMGSTLPDSGTTGGFVNLSGAITTIRITSSNGTSVFDSGSVSVIYEG